MNLNNFLVAVCSLLLAQISFAQPANNNCAGAITLIPGPVCSPISGTTAGATQSQVGCTGTANDDVWYTFIATSTGHSINVSGNGTFNPVLQVFQSVCGVTSLACVNATGNGGSESYQSTTLTVGNQYWVRVYNFGATIPTNTTFTICVAAPITEPACNPLSPQPANSMIPCPNVPTICQINGFCGTTQGYYATPGATTLTPYSVNTWPQLSAIFCGSIENNSFMQFTASASNVQLRVWGSCTSGTGIQMLAFTSTSGLCGSGSVLSHGCFSPLNLNTAPTTGIPLTFTGMIPGQTYYLMVDGFAGAVCNYKIGADYGVQVSAFVTPSTSNICLGTTVPLAAGGGNGTYTWNPSPTLSGLTGSSVIASPLATGTYTYTVNSASVDTTCPANSATATINVFDVPTPNAGIDDTVCFNSSGTIINLSGTSSNPVNATLWQYVAPPGPPPTFMFAPSAASPVTSVIVNQPGLYKFILRETNTICGVFRDTVNVLVLNHQQTLSYVPPTCNGGNDGTISVANPDAVEYSFDNGITYQTAPTLGGFAAGTYSICSKNYFGCQICSSITIVDLPAVTIAVSNDTLICENGTAVMSAVGSNGNNFNFAWSHTGDLLGTQSVSPLTPGYYYVTGTSDVGCVTPQDSIYVDILPPLSGSISSGVTICPTFNTIITSNGMDGNGGPYTHTWSTGAVGSGASHSVNVSPMTTTTYSVTISDGCETTPITFSTDVTVAPVPQPSFDVVVDSMCSPGLFTVFNTTDTAMVATAQWFISDGQGFSSLDTIVTSSMPTGSYDVTLTIVSPDGCVNSITANDYLVAMPIPISNFRFSPVVVTAYSTQVSFVNLSAGNDYNYWDFTNASPVTSTAVNPMTTFPEAIVDNYLVTLIVESQFGCLDTSYQIVEVLPEVLLFAPNTFTPDEDEHNSTWHIFIEGIDPTDFELVIYDRWGEKIWQSFDPDADWDGIYKGKLVPTGVYNWSLKTNDALNGKGYVWTGHINVLH